MNEMNMLEKCAKAVSDSFAEQINGKTLPNGSVEFDVEQIARAVLETLREPTSEMLFDACNVPTHSTIARTRMEIAWQRAIDSALKASEGLGRE